MSIADTHRNVDLRRFVPLDAAVAKGYGVVLLVAIGLATRVGSLMCEDVVPLPP